MKKGENKYFIFDNPRKIGIKSIVRKIITEGKSLVYKILLNFAHPKVLEKKYKVSVCAIFKNEAPYLKEWLEFNHLVGVEHFYMYNNNSDDDYFSVLEPYVKKGWVTLVQWPQNQRQMECYRTCIKDFASETKWLGFIDIDEFIVPKSTNNIYDFLRSFEKNYGAVNIYWRLYGSSGFMNRDLANLIVEDFTVCWSKYCDIGKCFYNTAFGFDVNAKKNSCLHHSFWANWHGINVPPVNVFGKISFADRNVAVSDDFPIQINHYFTKSYKEYALKRAKGDVYFKINPHDEEYFYEHEMKCISVDYSAYKYLIRLKLALKKND